MKAKTFRAFGYLAALAVTCSAMGCVSSRPSRNGVFDENQYLRKSFLIAPGDGSQPDPGWYMQATILQTSTPNPLAYVGGAALFAGSQGHTWGGPTFVRFIVTQDKLQIADIREISNDPTNAAQNQRTPAIVNAWPVTNVDLKYRVNLDGENTNFYEENQELDWQVRQWVKINFAKNDLSDLAPFNSELSYVLKNCTSMADASTTLVTNSFKVDEPNGYMEFAISLTVPISFDTSDSTITQTCYQAFGPAGILFSSMGRQTVSMNVLYSFSRPANMPANTGGYVPMPIAEKDPIQRKYGAFETIPLFRDPNTGLLGANQFIMRFDPNQNMVWYFAPGMPEVYKQFFVKPGGLVDSTNNNILAKSGGTGRLVMLNYNDATVYGDGAGPVRNFGDIRYNFINWHSDLDNGSGLLGIAQMFINPLTGQTLSANVNLFEGPFKDTIQQRLDFFLQTVGAEYLLPSGEFDDSKYPSSCNDGDMVPLVPADISNQLNRQSTVYGKMQAYLQKPFANWGYLGPVDFLPTHDSDFYNAFFSVLPYQVYADPASNPFVLPSGSQVASGQTAQWNGLQQVAQFNALASQVDHGIAPFDTGASDAIPQAAAFGKQWSALSQAVDAYQFTNANRTGMAQADDISLWSYLDIYQKNGRHCVGGKWESRTDYLTNLITSLNEATVTHEFGHTLGLRHNFMGSVDQRNYPLDAKGNPTLYASSIMDYNQQISEAFFTTSPNSTGWAPYDMAAIGWIYGNNLSPTTVAPVTPPAGTTASGISGQVSPTAPWNDPLGFQADGQTEKTFLFCTDQHLKYTPMCRQYDMGATPSEITANAIQQREWNYLWTNFRMYHKIWDDSNYATRVATDFAEMRRFLSLWSFDWSSGELTNTLRMIGTQVPPGANAGDYYTQLTNKFNQDISISSQLAATYQRAIIEQSSGERPFITVYDPYYGDVTQQGIQIDKVEATTEFSTLWPAISNYDPSQAGGYMMTSCGGQIGDMAYTTVSEAVLLDFLGATFATYTYAQLGPIANFADMTHSTMWPGDVQVPTWIGAYEFTREVDFLAYLRAIAVKYQFENCDENGQNCVLCDTEADCNWDPRNYQVRPNQQYQSDRYNRFQTPDGRSYIWGYLPTRNEWVLADKDRNVAMYTMLLTWTTDVVNNEDDGYSGASYYELKVKYMLDAFTYYNNQQLASQ